MIDGRAIFVVGKRGSGKTTYIKTVVQSVPRVLIWDWRGEYDYQPVELKDIVSLFRSPSFQRTYRPDYHSNLSEQFELLAHCILHMDCARNFLFVVDEAYMVCPNLQELSLGKLIRLTRPKTIDLMYSSQRPTLIPGILRSEADEFVVFKLINPQDVQIVTQIFGPDAGKQAQNLCQFQYLHLTT